MTKETKDVFIDRLPIARIQSGDLLAWRKDSHSPTSDLLIQAIRTLTKADYGHVGIAWRLHDGIQDELFVIEATIPKIRPARVMPDRDFDVIPMGVNWTLPNKSFLVSKIGLPYSVFDAARAYLGRRLEDDDRYQCAELADHFYRAANIILEHDYTPGGIVKAAEKYAMTKALRVVAETRDPNCNF